MNRSTLEYYLRLDDGLSMEYLGSPALLSEIIKAYGESILFIYRLLNDFREPSNATGMDFWILGASYNDTSTINAIKNVKCGANSCYEKA